MNKMAQKEEQKPQKGATKPEKKADKKKAEKGTYALYKIEGEKVTRLRPTCERCGPGYFMAKHQDRYTCGHCGFTRYKQVEQ
jgi:small subunit ribosomal protein S27Ae